MFGVFSIVAFDWFLAISLYYGTLDDVDDDKILCFVYFYLFIIQ